jgi:predicted ATP-dependent serine protease
MIEIDHTALPPPEPARPILASHLLAIEEKQRKRFSSRGERIRTGCEEIDDYMLGGGFERGILVGISTDTGEGRLVS